MCHTALLDSKFVEFLVRADEKMAEEMRAACCTQCGNALHLNSFPRKPARYAASKRNIRTRSGTWTSMRVRGAC
jgi:hypothetical protein